MKEVNHFFLACVEHLTGCPTFRVTKNATASAFIHIMEEEIIPPFGAPVFFICNNTGCYTGPILTEHMKKKGMVCLTVLSYAPMSNGRADRMVVTIKRSIGRIKNDMGSNCNELVAKAVFLTICGVR